MKKDLVTANEITITITKDELETLDWGLFLAEQDAKRKIKTEYRTNNPTSHHQQVFDAIIQLRKELNT